MIASMATVPGTTGAAPLPVLLAAAGEIALIGLLLFHVVGLGRRLKRTAMLRRVG